MDKFDPMRKFREKYEITDDKKSNRRDVLGTDDSSTNI